MRTLNGSWTDEFCDTFNNYSTKITDYLKSGQISFKW